MAAGTSFRRDGGSSDCEFVMASARASQTNMKKKSSQQQTYIKHVDIARSMKARRSSILAVMLRFLLCEVSRARLQFAPFLPVSGTFRTFNFHRKCNCMTTQLQ
jgi:hypothetical protein